MRRSNEPALLADVDALLADDAHRDNPLRPVLAELLQMYRSHLAKSDRQLQRLTRVSDRYQQMMHEANHALREASTHDLLTGLANRRFMLDRLGEIERRRAATGSGCIAMLDVDRFKAINDRHGHLIGDRVLVHLSEIMRSALRSSDLCARWGGEEFLLLLPDSTLEEAAATIERVRGSFAARPLPLDDGELQVTASFGIARWPDGSDFDETLRKADAALLAAKRKGRNCVEVAD